MFIDSNCSINSASNSLFKSSGASSICCFTLAIFSSIICSMSSVSSAGKDGNPNASHITLNLSMSAPKAPCIIARAPLVSSDIRYFRDSQ